MLRRFLQNVNHVNCQIYQAKGDTGVLVVTTAVESARQRITALVGDHTDLLAIDGMDVTSISNQNQLNSRRRVWNMTGSSRAERYFFTSFWDGTAPPVSTELAKLQR